MWGGTVYAYFTFIYVTVFLFMFCAPCTFRLAWQSQCTFFGLFASYAWLVRYVWDKVCQWVVEQVGVNIYAITLTGHIFNTLPAVSLLVVVQLCLLQEISCGEESWLVWFVLFFYIMKSFVPFCYYLFIICIVFILLFF